MIALQIVKQAVDDLYSFRDCYFERNGISEAAKKEADVATQLESTLKIISANEDDIPQKAELQMLRGKALNVTQSYSGDAQAALSKAVKLDPRLTEAWVQLGECYWKNGEMQEAQHCFLGALNHREDKTALRNLSMVLRQLDGDPACKAKHIKESVEKAKQALALDVKDGMSWLILGNAYLSQFFNEGQNPKVIQQCLAAYQQAGADPMAKHNADLHFNKATAHKYQEDYLLSLEAFSLAADLEPTWTEPRDRENDLIGYLTRAAAMARTKGKMKTKRLQSLLKSMKESDLGPYAGGSYTSYKGDSVTLTRRPLCDLQAGFNANTVVMGRVVCSLNVPDPVPFAFCLVDESETSFVVTIYNIATGSGVKIADIIAIPEPFVQDVDLCFKSKSVNYRSIRVHSPLVMVVNGRKWGIEKQAPTQLSVSMKKD